MKKNIIIILLTICVLGLGGFLVYDKVLKGKVVNNEKNGESIQYEKVGLSENFKTLSDLNIDSLSENFEKDYEVTLNDKIVKLTISNKFDFAEIAVGGGDNGEDIKSGKANLEFYLNDKKVFETDIQTFAPSYPDPNEIIGIAIYNNEYLAIKQMLDPNSSYETQNTNNLISFVNEEGKLYTESSYDVDGGMTFNGENIYYYADEDGSFENSKRYWDPGFGYNKVFKWKKTLGGSGTKIEECIYKDTGI